MKSYQTIVVLSIGPTCRMEFVLDTIQSIYYYCPNVEVIIINDGNHEAKRYIKNKFPHALILNTPGNNGKSAGLYLSLSQAFEYIVKNYNFEVILRMDSDAIILGYSPELDAIAHFKKNKKEGMIGSWKFDCNGDPRDGSHAKEVLLKETSLKHALFRPWRLKGVLKLKSIFDLAIKNGYSPGESVQGGSYFIRQSLLKKMNSMGLLGLKCIKWSSMEEDHIFSMLCYAAGFKLGDFATGSKPMGIRWQGLPCSPESLIERGKKIVHSVRFYKSMKEAEIRKFFKSYRVSRIIVT